MSAAATSLNITSGTGQSMLGTLAPNEYYILTLEDSTSREIVRVTGVAADALTVTRGFEGTTARTWIANSYIEMRVTKGTLENFVQGLLEVTYNEDLTSQVNGTATAFTVLDAPSSLAKTMLFYNGIKQRPTIDYTLSGTTITTTFTPQIGEVLVTEYSTGQLLGGGGGGGGGGTGDVTGPASSNDNIIARFNGVSGKIIQESLVGISDTGAITAPSVGSIIPFRFADQAGFPSAATYNGAIAKSDADGAMYFAHGGIWNKLVGASARTTAVGTTASIANLATDNISIAGFKSYMLMKVQVSHACWVRLYVDAASRTTDATRLEGVDPAPGSGVLAEIITTGAATQLITPATLGFNNDGPAATTMYVAVTNKSGATNVVTVTLTLLKLEE